MPEEPFDRVQTIRAFRARVKQPSPPSDDCLLRKLLCCERCGGRMHGTRGSRPPVRRYQCSTRRHGGDCTQPIVKAEPIEAQLVDWLHDFQPTPEMRKRILAKITHQTHEDDDQARRKELMGQADRLKDLYLLGDLTKAQYIMRRQAIQDELERLEPTIDSDVAEAEQLLSNFAEFWEVETAAAERRRLLLSLFEQVWEDGGRIVAVKPRGRLRPTSRQPRKPMNPHRD